MDTRLPIWAAVVVLVAAASLTTMLRRFLARRKVMDIPNGRSSHSQPVPRGGGLSIVLTVLPAVFILSLCGVLPANMAWAILGGGLLIAGVGLVDDVSPLPAWVRAVTHSAAAAWSIWCLGGMAPLHLGWSIWDWGWLGHLVALIGLVWMINLYNFMDGIDALAGSEAVYAGAAGVWLLARSGQLDLAAVALLLACASAGFLIWNWPPAAIFMGDVGSGFLGLILGLLAIACAKRQPALLWVWLILLGVFVVDASLTLVRRVLRGERWYSAHRCHAYQSASRALGSHGKVTLGVGVWNVAWLFPLAWWAARAPGLAPLLALVALSPLVWIALHFRAGEAELVTGEPSPRLGLKETLDPADLLPQVKTTMDGLPRFRMSGFARVLEGVLRGRLAYVCTIRMVQLGLFLVGGVTAFLLRFEFSIPREMIPALWIGVGVWAGAKVLVFHFFGLGRGMWRYFSTPDLWRLTKANAVASILAAAAILIGCHASFPHISFPRSVLIVDFLVSMVLSAGIRAVTRLALEVASRTHAGRQNRAFIYGGGAGGALLLAEARLNGAFGHVVCGFIDDNRNKQGMLINGVPVRGAGADLPRLAEIHDVRSVLIAIPSANGSQMTRIIQHCHEAGVSIRTMPSLAEMVAGCPVARQIREVAVEDILGREPVELDRRRISGRLRGKVALVTGAAGSIGSELCTQIARFQPSALVAFEISESALFHLERDIGERFPDLRLHAEIGSVQNMQRLREVFRQYAPSVVYHAAAYKHVPLMERHVFEAVENNVIGTCNLAMAAAEFAAEDFVLISSDKAVRPTNVMGATKRVAELVIRAFQNGGPRYVAVRFGNVLASNGSVVPIFKKQIAAGGPVTVTHPEMQRYFMTIPEAAQLVLQASVMGRGGETFVLNMGDPVRIVNLARQLILLSGLNPGKDIRIEFTGMRPGEKLCEELRLSGEHTLPTGHDKISVFAGTGLPFEQMVRHLARLRSACETRDLRSVVTELQQMVPDYAPGEELSERMVALDLVRLASAVSGAPADPVEAPACLVSPADPAFEIAG